MKKMKKSWLMMIAFALLISGIAGFAAPKEAKANWLFKYKHGYFSNYVETPAYSASASGAKSVTLYAGEILASSTAKGSFKLHIQIQPGGKGAWKTIKTIKANKNGRTYFDSPKFSPKDRYRFKLVNEGTKNRVNYNMMWAPFYSSK
ncbi:hypothetical protein [Sporosarcina sp. G11-34]|uniref:hypothetical protein n=1 Tax=Sporosarcina sp. G11-34 TaxID=2849605 RepID=UPI0022A94A95|nr:hypothetical protein [Sporosarcina sp. G11-34]MCZ2257331.1 hypothetical protein [Sporosarcina sp. G11-34]